MPLLPADLSTTIAEHFPRIHRAALVLTGNPWDADDLAQETFLILAREGSKFGGRSQLGTWLYGILLNLDRRLRRRAGTNSQKLRVLWDADQATPRSTPPAEAALEVSEWRASLWSFVARLPDGQRQVLVLRYSEEMSYDEIAAALECPLGTVKSRMFHGLAALRELLDKEGDAAKNIPLFPQEDASQFS